MPLTATQRQFILNRLNVHPRPSKRARAMTPGETLNRSIEQALDACLKAEGEALEGLRALGAIRGTETVRKPLETEFGETQRQLKAAQREGAVVRIQELTNQFQAQKQKAAEELKIAKPNESFYAKLDDTQKGLDELKKHKHVAHVATLVQEATTKIDEARKHAAGADFGEARKAMHAAAGAVQDGKDCADAYAVYLPIRAKAGRAVGSVKQWDDRTAALTAADSKATPAQNKYVEAGNELGNLTTELKAKVKTWFIDRDEGKVTTLRNTQTTLRSKLTDVPAGRFAALSDASGVTVLDDDVTMLANTVQTMKDHHANDRLAEVAQTAQATFFNAFNIAERTALRRLEYDKQRRKTLDKMNTLVDGTKKIEEKKGADPLVGHLFSMQELVRRADRLASRGSMRFEDGIAELLQIEETVRQLSTVASDAAAYFNARLPADERFEKLEKLPAAAVLGTQIDGIRKVLGDAAKSTGIVNAKSAVTTEGMEDHFAGNQNWAAATAQVKQAVALMAAAESLAATALGDTLALQDEAAGATDKPKALELIAKLRQRAATEKSKPHGADIAGNDYDSVESALRAATQAVEKGDFKTSTGLLESAATTLAVAQTAQGEHARYLVERKLVSDRADALNACTDPPLAKIKEVVDPVNEALTQAATAAKGRQWPAAHAALAAGTEAATYAELVARLYREFKLRYDDRDNKVKALADPMKTEADKVLAKAMQAADALNLDYANRYLDNIDSRLAGEKLKALAANPDSQDFLDAVDAMLGNVGGQELLTRPTDSPMQLRNKDKILDSQGKEIAYGKDVKSGPELLDELVAGLAETVHPKVLLVLAEKRFGIKLRLSGLYDDAGEVKEAAGDNRDFQEVDAHKDYTKRVKSGKQIYAMLAKIPEQAKNNPSVKTVERRNALKKGADGKVTVAPDSGGFYQTRDNAQEGLVVMSGRPGDIFQQFGANLKDANNEDQLGKVEPGYEPADDTQVDYFDFATVHEVGHGVDDRLGFMASRGSDAAYGGWIVYGGDFGPIVEAVAEHTGYGDTAEQKQYIRDLMTGSSPIAPVAPAKEAVPWEQARQKVLAWHAIATNESLWWNQGQTDKVTIKGRVYQEAYKNTWVSYLASARSKGLTGYQFRAPAEWFAELYAGYHCNKLKKGHPARQWLASLSL